jgi:hypothetical protein
LALFASAVAMGFAQAPNKCGDLAKIQIPGTKLEITRAEMVADRHLLDAVALRVHYCLGTAV